MTNVDQIERWLTLKEAATKLREEYGLVTTHENLKKLLYRSDPMPSALNFNKRQVKMSQVLPWLQEKGIVER